MDERFADDAELKGTDDANKILSNDGACPICDQVLSKSLMKPVDVNPNDEWVNMAMAGSAYRSVMFYIGQKELEMQFKMNKIVAQCRQKCEMMQEKFTEKLEQVHTAYQKMAKKCQMMQQEIESLTKDNQELQEKFAEKSRQKRKLDEMYDQLRNEYESVKRSAIQPASNFYSRNETDLFSNPPNIMDDREIGRKGRSVFTPATPGPREDVWPARQNSNNSGHFDLSVGSPAKQTVIAEDAGNRRAGAHRVFGPGATNNPSMTLRNLILSPIKRPQLSRNRPQLFTRSSYHLIGISHDRNILVPIVGLLVKLFSMATTSITYDHMVKSRLVSLLRFYSNQEIPAPLKICIYSI
ncbi:E3 ubiquitin-protein ligase CCNB1IP1-like protein, partial [Mucuna pruriens]